MNTYKPQEFAEMIGVSVKTLQRWDNDGKLKAFRNPSNRRYYTHKQYVDYIGGIDLKYVVIKPFNDITGFKIPGESIELDDARAAKLRAQGLIGGVWKDSENTRIAEILINEEWIKVNPIDIKKGNIFRMFESTGEPVIGDNNSVNWKAENDAKYNEDGIVVIDICD